MAATDNTDKDALLVEPALEMDRSASRWALPGRVVVTSLGLLGIVGIAAFASVGAKGARVHVANSLQSLRLWYTGDWNNGWNTGWNNGWNNGLIDGNKVPCGPAVCDCGWAMGDPPNSCGKVDNPQTPCWSCCCSRLYPELYRQALSGPFYPLPGYPFGPYARERRRERRDYDDDFDRRDRWDFDDDDDFDRRDRRRRADDFNDGWRVGQDEWYREDDFRRDPYFMDD